MFIDTLDLDSTKITDAGLEHLIGLNSLRSLVTDEGIQKLQQALPNCKISH